MANKANHSKVRPSVHSSFISKTLDREFVLQKLWTMIHGFVNFTSHANLSNFVVMILCNTYDAHHDHVSLAHVRIVRLSIEQ